jgi:ABC-type multidrug transport system fused ATPase/permease subunit
MELKGINYDSGTFKELFNQKGIFFELYKTQNTK